MAQQQNNNMSNQLPTSAVPPVSQYAGTALSGTLPGYYNMQPPQTTATSAVPNYPNVGGQSNITGAESGSHEPTNLLGQTGINKINAVNLQKQEEISHGGPSQWPVAQETGNAGQHHDATHLLPAHGIENINAVNQHKLHDIQHGGPNIPGNAGQHHDATHLLPANGIENINAVNQHKLHDIQHGGPNIQALTGAVHQHEPTHLLGSSGIENINAANQQKLQDIQQGGSHLESLSHGTGHHEPTHLLGSSGIENINAANQQKLQDIQQAAHTHQSGEPTHLLGQTGIDNINATNIQKQADYLQGVTHPGHRDVTSLLPQQGLDKINEANLHKQEEMHGVHQHNILDPRIHHDVASHLPQQGIDKINEANLHKQEEMHGVHHHDIRDPRIHHDVASHLPQQGLDKINAANLHKQEEIHRHESHDETQHHRKTSSGEGKRKTSKGSHDESHHRKTSKGEGHGQHDEAHHRKTSKGEGKRKTSKGSHDETHHRKTSKGEGHRKTSTGSTHATGQKTEEIVAVTKDNLVIAMTRYLEPYLLEKLKVIHVPAISLQDHGDFEYLVVTDVDLKITNIPSKSIKIVSESGKEITMQNLSTITDTSRIRFEVPHLVPRVDDFSYSFKRKKMGVEVTDEGRANLKLTAGIDIITTFNLVPGPKKIALLGDFTAKTRIPKITLDVLESQHKTDLLLAPVKREIKNAINRQVMGIGNEWKELINKRVLQHISEQEYVPLNP